MVVDYDAGSVCHVHVNDALKGQLSAGIGSPAVADLDSALSGGASAGGAARDALRFVRCSGSGAAVGSLLPGAAAGSEPGPAADRPHRWRLLLS